ncbi:MAG: tryptophan--tRNA ligase [Parcubacteria group bacterium]|nr:tryptophan--tRNA ligase [Parcubacteria group bacterium]
MKIISGIQPSGELHIGNYLGAIKNWLKLQADPANECLFFIADYHSITQAYNPKKKSGEILDLAIDLLALGLNPKKSVIFQQSQIPYHTELAWIFNTITPTGELAQMTQFKDKFQVMFDHFDEKHGNEKQFIDSIEDTTAENLTIKVNEQVSDLREKIKKFDNVGLFDYPVLMAADILIYKADAVPVGEDQIQHLELTRNLARRFNTKFGKTFSEPESLLTETPRIMSLTDPTKKMSKSHGEKSYIALKDSPEKIAQKIKSAVSDIGGGKDKGGDNLLSIFKAFSETKSEKSEYEKFKNNHNTGELKYAEFKPRLSELVANNFSEYRKKHAELSKNKKYVKKILAECAEKASVIAEKTLKEVKEKIGLLI